jgi:hypothetical protein
MWSGEYDKDKNTVSVRYEKGDTYEGLYKQLGMSAEDFANKYKVDLNKDISSDASFDITDKVLKQTDFSKDKSMMNCFSSSIYGTGALSEETPVQGGFNFTQDAQKVLGYEEVTQPQPGSIVTWEDNSGITNHAAIYVIKGNDGTSYYFGRPGPNSDVSIQSSKNTSTLYPNFKETFLRYSLSKPKF